MVANEVFVELTGERQVVGMDDPMYPEALLDLAKPPKELYVVGDPRVLTEPAISIVGARRATRYGLACAKRFAALAAESGVSVFSGGAPGIDAAAHEAALDTGGRTVAVLGGGCDRLYPRENVPLFQRIVEAGGAVVSEYPWDDSPKPYRFAERNRIVVALAEAVLVCEAGIPSGTWSACDEAASLGRPILAVPGEITSAASAGTNRLLREGAEPVVDDASFLEALSSLGLLGGCPAR